jgi:hypothetical protein
VLVKIRPPSEVEKSVRDDGDETKNTPPLFCCPASLGKGSHTLPWKVSIDSPLTPNGIKVAVAAAALLTAV